MVIVVHALQPFVPQCLSILGKLTAILPSPSRFLPAKGPRTEWLAQFCFDAGSLLTGPVCNWHTNYRLRMVDSVLHPTDCKVVRLARQCLFGLKLCGWGILTPIPGLLGIVLRSLGVRLQKEPFLRVVAEGDDKQLEGDSFLVFSENFACTSSGGHAITNANVLPEWMRRRNAEEKETSRLEDIVRIIIDKNADVICLCEIFNTTVATQLVQELRCEKLGNLGYKYFFHSMGRRGVGPGAALFFASRFPIKNFEFIPFSAESLVGRTKNCTKGFYEAQLQLSATRVMSVMGTHLQHSEISQFPTEAEVKARALQGDALALRGGDVIFGDFNLGNEELDASSWGKGFTQGTVLFGPDKKTWGGDQACAQLVGDPVSLPMNLDYALLNSKLKETVSIETSLAEVPYTPERLDPSSISDHHGLLTKVTFLRS